ncbi:mucoidy inhibitor MuiA family protein [Galbibacter pacificus]|uniref:Mucoidy inhibitor MuiA family protein n=1 Tax=Galbibacter pacificus TaxID=2996052 RepID=A0ABT6FT84_9FLAO|nr:mucoidy inhibitor MuiA family protein [Galbibacter pacificus]MDG3582400.1 mucoidy inhibitor MuiA family protein [Galbibacter pacificus]MDG3586482.1 mucoidy inhibitor MuiA family protein [Galbibacter pacificus]
MYKLILPLFFLLSNYSEAQNIVEKEIKTDVSAATVFLDGAQIKRQKTIYLEKGVYILKFVNLSPYIQEKTINLGAENGNLTILSLNFQTSFQDNQEKPSDLQKFESVLKQLEEQKILEQTYLDVIHEDIAFLKENRNLNGKNEALSVSNLKDASNFYSNKLTSLKLKEIDRYKVIAKLNEEISTLQSRINEFSKEHEYNLSEIVVKIDNKTASQIDFSLGYIVKNASWYPTYDLKASSSTNYINIVHKANVRQDTKVDWENVTLTFSSSNPNISGTPPSLKTYYLDYNLPPPSYNEINEVSGVVSDEMGDPIPGVNVIIENTTIGTTTNFDGKYTLSIPKNSERIIFSYIGYKTAFKPINNSFINVRMETNNEALEEVVVSGYGKEELKKAAPIEDQLAGRVNGLQISNQRQKTNPEISSKRNTSLSFKIDVPYSISSNNKNNTIEMTNNQITSDFHYFSIPKLQEDVFLIAKVIDWKKYDLLDGEANIFYENTFVGKTVLELNSQNDTLNISFGKDQNITIKRERNKDLKSKKFLGSNKEQLVGWTITIKNNKSVPINLTIIDQVPVSNRKEIEVKVEKLSNGKINPQTGEVEWELFVKPTKTEKIDLNYSVTSPKNNSLYIE